MVERINHSRKLKREPRVGNLIFIVMKTKTLIVICALLLIITSSASAQRETCGNWSKDYGSDIQFRTCIEDGIRSYQFFNGYSFEVHFYCVLVATDGSTTGTDFNSGYYLNLYLDAGQYSDKGATDMASGVNKQIASWRITKKLRKDINGNWVEF